MENNLKISLSELTNCASQIRSQNANLDDTLAYVSRQMNELNAIWLSDGEQTLLSRFQSFANKFIAESEVIESYAQFLDDTVASYDSLESTIVSNASNF